MSEKPVTEKIVVSKESILEQQANEALRAIGDAIELLEGQPLRIRTFHPLDRSGIIEATRFGAAPKAQFGLNLTLESSIDTGELRESREFASVPICMDKGGATVMVKFMLEQGALTKKELSNLVDSINRDAEKFGKEPPIK